MRSLHANIIPTTPKFRYYHHIQRHLPRQHCHNIIGQSTLNLTIKFNLGSPIMQGEIILKLGDHSTNKSTPTIPSKSPLGRQK